MFVNVFQNKFNNKLHANKYVSYIGNDYGVCCPASLKIQKTGTCPVEIEKYEECGNTCTHDLECPSIQKCCNTERCGSSCANPKNVTGK